MQNWSILAKFAKKNPAKSAVFYWLFLGEVSPQNCLWNRPIFLSICPWKSFEIWLFSAKIPQNRPIFEQILTFLPRNQPIFERILTFSPRKSREIGRFFREFAPENPAKFCFFFREISEALYRSVTISAVISQLIDSSMYCYGLSAFQCMLSNQGSSFIATRMLFLFAHI